MLKINWRCNIDYETCYKCIVSHNQINRHLSGDFKTHSDGPVVQHMKECKIGVGELEVDVLKCIMKGGFQLSTMEALFIRELKPALNTRDEYQDHELTIKIWFSIWLVNLVLNQDKWLKSSSIIEKTVTPMICKFISMWKIVK